MIICEFTVPCRPVPWSVPRSDRAGHFYKKKSLVAWQKAVATCARAAMAGRKPCTGPVEIGVHFSLTMPSNRAIPDWTNLVKSCEDALQGIVFRNDRQVCVASVRRTIGDWDGAVIRVSELEG